VPEDVESREAKHGERMIEVRVRFWTNDLAEGEGQVRPRHAWGSGVVRIQPNKSHGITGRGKPLPFNSLAEIPAKIEQELIAHGITIHRSRKMKRYMPEA
jgi:hypothetical protein